MKTITLGKTGISSPQNAFGALPIQRVEKKEAIRLLKMAHDGGMTFFDTARAYSDSEEKIGAAFKGMRDKVTIATKTMARDSEKLKEDLETSLKTLGTDYIDIYQIHIVPVCYRPDDGTGMYEALMEAKKEGKILHAGITAHKIGVAEEIAESGLYETLQYPFSYLASERDIRLVKKCEEEDVGFIAMKGLAGGLLRNSKACMAFMNEFSALPIWGIQRESELKEWLEFFNSPVSMTEEINDFIEKERKELLRDFCRGCGYCSPCTVDIVINQCARMSQMIRRAPSADWLSDHWKNEMLKIENCTNCGVCKTRCPYELDIPVLLKKNLEDYKNILAGRVTV